MIESMNVTDLIKKLQAAAELLGEDTRVRVQFDPPLRTPTLPISGVRATEQGVILIAESR